MQPPLAREPTQPLKAERRSKKNVAMHEHGTGGALVALACLGYSCMCTQAQGGVRVSQFPPAVLPHGFMQRLLLSGLKVRL